MQSSLLLSVDVYLMFPSTKLYKKKQKWTNEEQIIFQENKYQTVNDV